MKYFLYLIMHPRDNNSSISSAPALIWLCKTEIVSFLSGKVFMIIDRHKQSEEIIEEVYFLTR